MGVGLTIVLQLISCVVLTLAIVKIKRVVNEGTGAVIQVSQLVLHLSSYYIYIISFIVFEAFQIREIGSDKAGMPI